MKVPEFRKIVGTESDEDLIGSSGREQLYGYGGKDRLYANGGDDQLYGGAGNDCWTVERALTSCMGGRATISIGSTILRTS